MEDPLSWSDVILALSPLLAALWLVSLGCVLRDLRRVSPTGVDLSRCGLPCRPLPPAPLQRFLASRPLRAFYPRGDLAR